MVQLCKKIKKITFLNVEYFNLVEIALAIAIIGIGMAGIMALYPVALKAARDSVGNNYSMLAGEQFLSYLKGLTDSNWTFINTSVQATRPTISDTTTATNDWADNFGNIYTTGTGLVAGQVYGIKMGSGNVTDFSAHAIIWKSPLTNTVFNGSTASEFTDTQYENSAILNIELSWPAEMPYSRRTKRTYSIMVAKK